MSFWWGSNIQNFLFYGCNIKSVPGLVSTCFGLAALSFTFEWLKLLQAKLRQKELHLKAKQLRDICPSESATLLTGSTNVRNQSVELHPMDRAILYFREIFLWFSIYNLGYLLMLVVMVYNGWMLIAIIVGGALGYFLFGPSFIKINLQNCELIQDTYCRFNCGESASEDKSKDGESTPAVPSCHSQTSVTVHSSSNEA